MVSLLVLCLLAIDPNAGTTGFEFIRIAPTAREAAMAGATTADARSAMAFWYSPVHALGIGNSHAHLGYVSYLAGIQLGSAAYSRPLAADKGIGIGIMYLNSGSMKRTDALGNELGTFGVSFADLNISGAMQLSDLVSLGVGIQGLYGSIDTFYGLGLAANLGVRARVPFEGFDGLYAGLNAHNVGYQVEAFQEGRDPMPSEFAFGLAWLPSPSFSLAVDALKPLDNKLQFRGGIEGWIGNILALRGGYSTSGADLKSGGGSDILAGFTTGLGIRYQKYQLDYAFIPMVELGMTHRLSLSIGL